MVWASWGRVSLAQHGKSCEGGGNKNTNGISGAHWDVDLLPGELERKTRSEELILQPVNS